MTEVKNRGDAPENKVAGREGGEPEVPFGPDGTFHAMEAEMLAAAKTKDADENQEPLKPSVIHAEELRMKGEAIEGAIDTTPPDPEAPIDARAEEARRNQDEVRRQKATQTPANKRR